MNYILLILAAALAFGAYRLWRLSEQAKEAGKKAEAACPPLGRFLEVEGPTGPIRMHFVDQGPKAEDSAVASARPPILMIHGLSGSLRHFSATVLDDLARDHRVIAIDRPGMGYSDQPPGGPFGPEAQAETLDVLLEELAAAPPLVVGHSLGGAVALALALRRPVAGLLLLAPATHPFKNKPPTPDKTVDSAFMRKALAYTVGPTMIEKLRPQSLATAFGPQSPPPEFSIAGGGVLMMRPSQIETTMADGSLSRPALERQSAKYAAIEAPITILFGDEDRVLDAEDHAPPLQAKAPQTKLELLKGVGHMIPFSDPERVVSAAREMTGAPAPD